MMTPGVRRAAVRCARHVAACAVLTVLACGSEARAPAQRVEPRAGAIEPRVITYGDDPSQFGQLWIPRRDDAAPVVILIHGGCWLAGYGVDEIAALARALAEAGYAVWSLEYRRVGNAGGGWPGTFLDVAAGADHVRALAASHPLDPTRVVAAGHSAGGHLALWLAARPRIDRTSELFNADPIAIHGVLGLAPAPDLAALHASGACGDVITGLMGGSPSEFPDRYRAGTPAALAPLGVPQIVMVGGRDHAWAPNGRAYVAQATAAGDVQVQLEVAPTAGHFEVVDPSSTTWPLVRDALARLVR